MDPDQNLFLSDMEKMKKKRFFKGGGLLNFIGGFEAILFYILSLNEPCYNNMIFFHVNQYSALMRFMLNKNIVC